MSDTDVQKEVTLPKITVRFDSRHSTPSHNGGSNRMDQSDVDTLTPVIKKQTPHPKKGLFRGFNYKNKITKAKKRKSDVSFLTLDGSRIDDVSQPSLVTSYHDKTDYFFTTAIEDSALVTQCNHSPEIEHLKSVLIQKNEEIGEIQNREEILMKEKKRLETQIECLEMMVKAKVVANHDQSKVIEDKSKVIEDQAKTIDGLQNDLRTSEQKISDLETEVSNLKSANILAARKALKKRRTSSLTDLPEAVEQNVPQGPKGSSRCGAITNHRVTGSLHIPKKTTIPMPFSFMLREEERKRKALQEKNSNESKKSNLRL